MILNDVNLMPMQPKFSPGAMGTSLASSLRTCVSAGAGSVPIAMATSGNVDTRSIVGITSLRCSPKPAASPVTTQNTGPPSGSRKAP